MPAEAGRRDGRQDVSRTIPLGRIAGIRIGIKGDFGSATRIAAGVGRAFGYLLIAAGVALVVTGNAWGGVWLALIGWFLVQAATAEGRQASAAPA
jgi:hypothetical protein